MKKNKPIQKLIKPSISKLSPSNKNKSSKYANFNLTSFKNNEYNKLISSPKKIKEENILSKKNLYPYSAYHRKTKSSSQNYIQFQNLMSDEIYNLNFTKTGNCINNSNSRNKYDLFKKKFNENKKSSNLLSISFSLKDFRNNIINAFINTNYNEVHKYNKSNIKDDKSLFLFDNLNNIEETRNTTSITGFNNSNLFNKKQMLVKDNKKIKSTKLIKINGKSKKQLFSPNCNSTKIITYLNNQAKNITENEHENNKLYHYIYNHSNININQNNDIKNKSSIPKKNLALSKKTYKNSASKLQKSRKISFVNAISENLKLHYKNKMNNYEIKNDFNYNIKSIKNNKEKKDIYIKPYKKRKNRSQESKGKTGAEYLNEIGQFQSVEEIHFIFVQMNQKKKVFFENKSNESINN
jgi:hypothetical protein